MSSTQSKIAAKFSSSIAAFKSNNVIVHRKNN